MERSRWITIGAIVVFILVTAQLVHFSWKKSQMRKMPVYVDTPEALAARREKDKAMKDDVVKMMQKVMAEHKKSSAKTDRSR